MNARNAAAAIGAGRLAFGLALMAAPEKMTHGWFGDDAARPVTKLAARAIGARDAVLGLGALMALRRGQPPRGWIEAGIAADVSDFATTLLAIKALPLQGALLTLALAGGSAYGGLRTAQALGAGDEM